MAENQDLDIRAAIESRRRRHKSNLRALNRVVFIGVIAFVPLYLGIKLTGGSAEKLSHLPDLLDRVRAPIRLQVPDDGVRYLNFYHGDASSDHKFVLVTVALEARMKVGYAVVPKCFRLLADDGTLHFSKSRSPLFIEAGGAEIRLDRDDALIGELLFEIPANLSVERLLFDRYVEDDKPAEGTSV